MANEFGNSYSSYFSILKTTKKGNEIDNIAKVNDRLIITHDGILYFDFNENDRIKITSESESYKYNGEFNEKNTTMNVNYSDLTDFNNDPMDDEGKILTAYSTVYDENGNIGVITSVNSLEAKCEIYIITDFLSAAKLKERNIKRIEFNKV